MAVHSSLCCMWLCSDIRAHQKAMSRGGRGGRGGGRGGLKGSGAFGAGSMPPMGLTFADIQAISREADALYPVRLEILFIVTRQLPDTHIYPALGPIACAFRLLRRGEENK